MRRKLAVLLSAAMVLSCTMGSFGTKRPLKVQAAVSAAEELHVSDLLDMSELSGWAAVAGEGLEGTTGGGNAKPVVVTTKDEFAAAVSGDIPRVVIVSGEIISMTSGVKEKGGYAIDIGSNKTIVGMDKNAALYGGINIKGSRNIIVSNLNIHGVWPYTGPSDTVNIENSHHIWLNHLNVWNSKDGNIDTKLGADYITISWCKLWYEDVVCEWDTKDGTQGNRQYKKGETARARDHGHRLACLIGSGAGDHDDTDMGKLHVTYHHNWFADNLDQRMPRIMYGRAHIYNNYYSCSGNSYCVAVDCYGAALVEKNYFQNVNNPHQFHYDNAYPASIVARNNVYDGTEGKQQEGQKSGTAKVALYETTVYDYFLNDAEDVPKIVQGFAGPGNGVNDTQNLPAEMKKGTQVKGVEPTPEKADTSKPLPTLAPANSKNDNAVTYDSSSKTYTCHGQNTDGSNAYYTIANPFAGKDFSENPAYKNGYPVWTKGVTIAYWVKLPKGKDAVVMNFNLENDRQIQREDAVHYNKCSAYSPADASYSLGTMKKYVDEQGRIYTVLAGYGSNVRYNPNYPKSGYYYATDKGGAYYVYEKGSDPAEPSSWTYLDYIGRGYYADYAYLYDEEGGDGNSRVSEALISGSFSLYGSGTLGYRQDNWSGLQKNPNLDNYGQTADMHQFNQFYYFGNGGLYTLKGSSLKTPTMADTASQWHYVVTVIKNDWVQLYMDGKEITTDYLNYWGQDLLKNFNFAGQGFNLGYGGSKHYRTDKPAAGFSTDMLLLDFLSDKNTVLTIGGLGAGAEKLSMHTIGTPDGTQIKGLEFYDIPVDAGSISADGITLKDGYTEAPPKSDKPKQQKFPIVYDKDLDPIITQGPVPSGVPMPSEPPKPGPGASEVPTASAGAANTPSPNPQEFEWGDVDQNHKVNLKDAQLALKLSLNLAAYTSEEQKKLGDVMNPGDGITLKDAQAILKRALNLDITFDVEKKAAHNIQ